MSAFQEAPKIVQEIRERLYGLQDLGYRDFQWKLIPGLREGSMIGVRTPALRALAKELSKCEEIKEFYESLPHTYFEENQIHAFLISGEKDYEECMHRLEAFLPYVDNWATCDQMSPRVFRRKKGELEEKLCCWLGSGETYTVRFAIKMRMEHFLKEDYKREHLYQVAGLHNEEYYVRMMQAWYFATALIGHYEDVKELLQGEKLDAWTHNKTIQKAVESYRIPSEHKMELRQLKR